MSILADDVEIILRQQITCAGIVRNLRFEQRNHSLVVDFGNREYASPEAVLWWIRALDLSDESLVEWRALLSSSMPGSAYLVETIMILLTVLRTILSDGV